MEFVIKRDRRRQAWNHIAHEFGLTNGSLRLGDIILARGENP